MFSEIGVLAGADALNYSDGLSNVNLPEMIKAFRASGKVACFTAVRPSFSLHLVDMRPSGLPDR
jgi:glucose-1-phosphate cytidylyltransferase